MAPHLPLPDDATAGPALAGEYAAARARGGSVMAILRAMGPRAEVVQAFLALSEAALYGPAELGRRERELLALATSQANDAGYSAAVHGALLDELGGGPDAGARDRALVDFARAPHARPARGAGGGDRRCGRTSPVAEVYDAIAVVGLLNFANRAALATGITPADDLSRSA